MSWVSFDDATHRMICWDDVSFEGRWLYFATVCESSSIRQWDGKIKRNKVLRCSDVPDAERCIVELVDVGLFRDHGEYIDVALIDDHIPPEHLRPEVLLPRKRAAQQAYRERKCERGEHDRHCPKGCPARGRQKSGLPVTRPVTRRVTPGSGREGQALEVKGLVPEPEADSDPADTSPPCGVDFSTGELVDPVSGLWRPSVRYDRGLEPSGWRPNDPT